MIVATVRAKTNREIASLVNGLALLDFEQMASGQFPPLYRSGVRYQREPLGEEKWLSAREVIALGKADCEDLVAYRLAELWRSGVRGARAHVVRGGPRMRHVLVRYADGRIEDPSKALGMPT